MEHQELYKHPLWYDIAFDVRPVKQECAFMRDRFERLAKRKLASAVELASGPGYHALEFSRMRIRSLAVDLEAAMVEYLREKAERQETLVEVLQGDMRDFTLPYPVDLAYTLFGSFNYLLTNQDILNHFRAVYQNLAPAGIYIVELPHPRRFLRGESVTQDTWTERRGDIEVTTRWDVDRATPDALTQVCEIRSEFEVRTRGKRRVLRTRGRQRVLFAQEIRSLAETQGLFTVREWYGSMDSKIHFDYSKKSWRMVAVLQKL